MRLDPVTRTLVRTQGEGIISEFDAYALEMAVRLAKETAGRVTAITMGPPCSESVLRECLARGADEAALLSDRAMGGADAYATVNVLAAAARTLADKGGDFDLILCGQQAADSDTSLVMPELAEALGLRQVSFVKDYELVDGELRVWREQERADSLLAVALPAVLSVGKTVFPPRFPNIKRKLAANRALIPVYDAAALGLCAEDIGVNGSRTSVGDSYFPEHSKNCVEIGGAKPEEKARNLLSILRGALKG